MSGRAVDVEQLDDTDRVDEPLARLAAAGWATINLEGVRERER